MLRHALRRLSHGASSSFEFRHEPVLLAEVVRLLAPVPRGLIVDCTVGGGGHAAALLDALPHIELLGLDLDPAAVAASQLALSRFGARARVMRGSHTRLPALLAAAGHVGGVAGVLVDLGVSSRQLDDARAGFSLRSDFDGPLDMRFGGSAGGGVTAAQLVNGAPEGVLRRILTAYGEEPRAAAVARAIVMRRAKTSFEGTADLAAVVAGVVRRSLRMAGSGKQRSSDSGGSPHPAMRTFQALRIAVNDELGALDALLRVAPPLLAPGGRFCAIAFHSLEDRAVKRAFAAVSAACGLFELLGGPMLPTADEVGRNPRARSAKLRGLVRRSDSGPSKLE